MEDAAMDLTSVEAIITILVAVLAEIIQALVAVQLLITITSVVAEVEAGSAVFLRRL